MVPTKRRRFLWAAWWSAPPEADPFRKPDASSGGARTREEALAAAEQAAGQRLVEIDGRWAGAWVRVLRGDPPWPKPRVEGDADRASAPPPAVSKGSPAWARGVLGIGAEATADEVKRAFRMAALRTHPDRGGDEAAFIDVKRALDVALSAAGKTKRQRRRAH
ncbi:MAG: DnaJ domain-containing protein [Minicystis sp.]